MTPLQSIALGIISGIITSLVLVLVGVVFKQILVPWYQRLTYQGLDIAGVWQELIDYEDIKDTLMVNIRQQAHKISGSATLIKHSIGNQVFSRQFNLSGTFFDGYLVLFVRSTDRTRRGYFAFLLRVTGDGHSLHGKALWYDIGRGLIYSRKAGWFRGEPEPITLKDVDEAETLDSPSPSAPAVLRPTLANPPKIEQQEPASITPIPTTIPDTEKAERQGPPPH